MGTASRSSIVTLGSLCHCLTLQQRFDDDLIICRELDAAISDPAAEELFRVGYCTYLGGCLTVLHRYAEARQPLLNALAILKAKDGPRDQIRGVMVNLAEGYEALGEREEATKWRREIEVYQSTATSTAPTNTHELIIVVLAVARYFPPTSPAATPATPL